MSFVSYALDGIELAKHGKYTRYRIHKSLIDSDMWGGLLHIRLFSWPSVTPHNDRINYVPLLSVL